LAPLRPVIDAVLAQGVDPVHRRLVVLIGTRTPADLCFASELDAWAEVPGVEVRLTVDHLVEPADSPWRGRVGVVTSLVERSRAWFEPERSVAYVCGPEVMMRYAARELASHGVPEAAIQVSAERSMTCGVGHCGHCQLGPVLICRDGPVTDAGRLRELTAVRAR
jgi:anaerobic sulfite reductase subunit B